MTQVFRHDWSALLVPEIAAWQPDKTVSVVIPAYQCQESLDVVLAALSKQTYPEALLEVVVADDGSDPPLRLPGIRPRNCRIVRVPEISSNWGIANAVDVAVRESSGEIIQRLDADMLVFPEHVEAMTRWHHEIPNAVVLGSKRFVDTAPGKDNWPSPEQVNQLDAGDLFELRASEGHTYIDTLLAETDLLRKGDHLNFRAHVGATVSLSRQLYLKAGGMNADLRRGSDTEFGYRLTQAGALFIPELAARSWHLGRSAMMRDSGGFQRYSRPFLADLMPHPRWLRGSGGTTWAVPLVVTAIQVDGQKLETVRAAVDAVLRGTVSDVEVHLVGDWEALDSRRTELLGDPLLDLRLIAATYRSESRVRLTPAAPSSAFPAPYLLELPPAVVLPTSGLACLVHELDEDQAGLLHIAGPDGEIRLWRTAALERASLVTPGVPVVSAVETLFGSVSRTSVVTSGHPMQTIEVGGVRTLLKAARLVGRTGTHRIVPKLRRWLGL